MTPTRQLSSSFEWQSAKIAAEVVMAIDNVQRRAEAQFDANTCLDIVKVPASQRGVYARDRIEAGALQLWPLTPTVTWREASMAGGSKLGIDLTDYSGKTFNLVLSSKVVWPALAVAADRARGSHAAHAVEEFIPHYWLCSESADARDCNLKQETHDINITEHRILKLPCYTNKKAISKGTKLCVFVPRIKAANKKPRTN